MNVADGLKWKICLKYHGHPPSPLMSSFPSPPVFGKFTNFLANKHLRKTVTERY